MNVVVEPLPNCLTTLKVELEPERLATARESVTAEYGKHAKIPGYRPGKAPRQVVERKFKKQIREELEQRLIRDTMQEAIKSKGLRVLQVASMDEVNIPEESGAVTFTATLVTHPEFELPVYKGLVVPMHPTEVDRDGDRPVDRPTARAGGGFRGPGGGSRGGDGGLRGGRLQGDDRRQAGGGGISEGGQAADRQRRFLDQDDRGGVFPRLLRESRGREAGRDAGVRCGGAGGFSGRRDAGADDSLRGDAQGDQSEGAAGA